MAINLVPTAQTHECNVTLLAAFLAGSPDTVTIRLQLETMTTSPLDFTVLGLHVRTWERLEEILVGGKGVDFASSESEQVAFLDRHLHCPLIQFGDVVLWPQTSTEEQSPSTPTEEPLHSPSDPEIVAEQTVSRFER